MACTQASTACFWVGDKDKTPTQENLINTTSSLQTDNKALFFQKWDYDKDLFPIATNDFSGQKEDPLFSKNSTFSYDEQGRLTNTKGDWGQINYSYSQGGKIKQVIRSGVFIANRISKGQTSLTDIYNYSNASDGNGKQEGILNSVVSSDGAVSANLNFNSDEVGFRTFSVIPTLATLASGVNGNGISAPQQSWGFERREPLKAVLKHEPPKGDWT